MYVLNFDILTSYRKNITIQKGFPFFFFFLFFFFFIISRYWPDGLLLPGRYFPPGISSAGISRAGISQTTLTVNESPFLSSFTWHQPRVVEVKQMSCYVMGLQAVFLTVRSLNGRSVVWCNAWTQLCVIRWVLHFASVYSPWLISQQLSSFTSTSLGQFTFWSPCERTLLHSKIIVYDSDA